MANPYEAAMYAVVYGKEAPELERGVEWLSKYVIRGFGDETSRFEQAINASTELEEEADQVEIWRLRSDETEQFRQASGRPVMTHTGLVAELIAESNGEGGLTAVPTQPPPPKDVSPFPGIHIYVQ